MYLPDSWIRPFKKILRREYRAAPIRNPAHRTRLNVERLEDRTVPTTIFWNGQGGDNAWENPANWDGNNVPSVLDDAYIGQQASPSTKMNLAAQIKIPG